MKRIYRIDRILKKVRVVENIIKEKFFLDNKHGWCQSFAKYSAFGETKQAKTKTEAVVDDDSFFYEKNDQKSEPLQLKANIDTEVVTDRVETAVVPELRVDTMQDLIVVRAQGTDGQVLPEGRGPNRGQPYLSSAVHDL